MSQDSAVELPQQNLLPDPEPSRRELDPAHRAVLLIASSQPAHRLTLLQSEELLDAVSELVNGYGMRPEEISQAVAESNPLEANDPAGSLAQWCRRLPEHFAARSPVEAALTPAVAEARRAAVQDPPTTSTYRPQHLAKEPRQVAARGWRRLVRLAPGADERTEAELIRACQAPIAGYRHVVVLSLKGGSGKTTTTVMLGHTFATHRGDRVAAVDASPDAGTLAFRIADEPASSVRTLLENADDLRRYVDVRPLSGHTVSRLEVISSDVDPTVVRPFGGADYRRAADLLTRFYSLVLTDCGAGLMHDAMGAVLDSADQIVLVLNASVDGARSASLTLDWLDAHGYADLVRGAVTVINAIDKKPVIELDDLRQHFGARCRDVVEVPTDRHLAEGGATDLARLAPATRRAYLRLAATVASGFENASARRGGHR